MSQATLSAALRVALLTTYPASGALNNAGLTAFCDGFAETFWAYLSMVAGTGLYFTTEGGLAVRLANKTGVASVKGSLVMQSASVDRAFSLTTTSVAHPIGVVYEAGIADGAECLIVIAGFADALIEAGSTITRGYWAGTGAATAGRVQLEASVPAATQHFTEVGHCLESKANGGSTLARLILHWN
jgi:hypothetical protein